MKKTAEYKGYQGAFAQAEDQTIMGVCFMGEATASFQAETEAQIQTEFEISIDDYLAWAQEDGFPPEKQTDADIETTVQFMIP